MESGLVLYDLLSNLSSGSSHFSKALRYNSYVDDVSGEVDTEKEIYYSTENSSISVYPENKNGTMTVRSRTTEVIITSESGSLHTFTTLGNIDHWPENEDDNHLFEIPVSMIILLFLLYGAICVTALVGNALVLGLSMCSGKMRTVTNLFIANLALADIIIGLFTIPFQFQAALLQRWDLPHFLCALCPFVQVLSVNVSVFTLSAIAVDRYRAVIHPLKVQASKRKASWLILSIWILGFLLALPTEFDYQVTFIPSENGELKPFCANNFWLSPQNRMYYNQSIVVLQYFLPLCIITCAYIRMGSKLWKNQSPGNKEQSRDALLLRNKKKVIKMLSLVVILFALCWFPLQTYNFIQYVFPSVNSFYYINVLWFTFHLLAMSNSCCNPFVYAIYNEKFRKEFTAKMGACLPQRCGAQEMAEEIESQFEKRRATSRKVHSPSILKKSEIDSEMVLDGSLSKVGKGSGCVGSGDYKSSVLYRSEREVRCKVEDDGNTTVCVVNNTKIKNSWSFPFANVLLKKLKASGNAEFV